MISELDNALRKYAEIAMKATGIDAANLPGAGAAGGLGAGMLFFCGAKLRPGVDIVLEATGFVDMVKTAHLVITGEGRTDFQTAHGKAPVGIAKVAKQFGVPVICLKGGLGDGADDVLDHGIDGLMSIVPRPMPLEQCIEQGEKLIEDAVSRLCRLIKVGMDIEENISKHAT
jgi:glycerate kinase